MRFARRALAVLVTILIVMESAGVAQAVGSGATVHCCCGPHSAARKCRCSSCPVVKRRERGKTTARLAAGGDCDARSGDGARLVTLAVPPAPLPSLAAPFCGRLSQPAVTAPPQRLSDGDRPPP